MLNEKGQKRPIGMSLKMWTLIKKQAAAKSPEQKAEFDRQLAILDREECDEAESRLALSELSYEPWKNN